MIPIQIKNKRGAIFINSKASKVSDLHRLIFYISYKINLKASDKYVASTTQVYREYIKVQKEIMSLKFQLIHGMKNLRDGSYSVSDIQGYFQYITEKHETLLGQKTKRVTDNPPITINVKKIENEITFKIKTAYYLELSTPESTKLLGSSKIHITKDKNLENMLHLEIIEVIFFHCNTDNNDLFQINNLVSY